MRDRLEWPQRESHKLDYAGSNPAPAIMRMKLALYENDKRVGFLSLAREGTGIHSKYQAKVHKEPHNATTFSDDYSLARGLKIARRCFPGKLIDIEVN